MQENVKHIVEGMQQDIDPSGWPTLRLKKLILRNFGRHENVTLDLSSQGGTIGLACLVGPNGTGKTTILDAIQLLFDNYNGYTGDRYRAKMISRIRNKDGLSPMALDCDFSVKGVFISDGNEYEVEVTSKEVVSRHPEAISSRFAHYCYYANFDRELHMFTLKRKRWEQFRKFFSGMTGYAVEEDSNVFDQSDNKDYAKMLKEYVLGFRVEKPGETISHRRCSAGERKVIKCFSTILNRSAQPAIILIDNVTDHVEIARHLPLMQHLQECFPESQIISTCHSIPVQRNFPDRDRIIDMRVLSANPIVVSQPWRLRMIDEIWDAVEKVKSVKGVPQVVTDIKVSTGEALIDVLINDSHITPRVGSDLCYSYIKSVMEQVCDGFMSCPSSRISSSTS
jgi:energy-coupling factor transporter ATP-binding protein EcfA2